MPDGETNDQQVETVSKAEYEAKAKELDGLKESHKSLQRSYENLRRQGGNVSSLEKRLDANEKLQLTILETLGKLGVEGIDVKPALEEYKKAKESEEQVDAVRVAASESIIAAFEAAGIDTSEFETTWQTDDRFATARTLFSSGKYAEAAKESIKVLSKPVTKVFTEEDIKKAADEAVAKDRQARAAQVDPGPQTNVKPSGAITTWEQVTAWRNLPADERLKDYAKVKEFMRKNG